MSAAAPISEPVGIGNVPLPELAQLPNDVAILQQMIVELVASLREERRDKERLQHRLQQLLQRLYGPRTERFNPDQGLLFAEGAEDQAGQAPTPPPNDAPPKKTRRRCRPHGRGKLPDNLPRRPQHHELTEAERICSCGHRRIEIGTDVSEQLDWQPASLFVWQHVIHKYLCPNCRKPETMPAGELPTENIGADTADTAASVDTADTTAMTIDPCVPANLDMTTLNAASGPAIVSARKPAMPIAKGLPGPGLLAYIIVSKYFDHLPLYRLERILARQGVPLARSTTCDWMAACAELLQPLYDLMLTTLLQSAWLHTDDTPVKNRGHAPGSTAIARFWIYWGDRTHPYNVFDFTVNRKRDGPQRILANFQGYLHADAFSGYDALYLPPPRADAARIQEVACNAHARRKFHEARGSDTLRAHRALAYYGQLYELERAATATNLDDAGRLQMRQDLSLPILAQFHTWLEAERPQVLPKSPMAEAIGYALNNWDALQRYTEAGFLSIDNNVAEREMKRIAIGRKNWLFVGSDQGGTTAAVHFSFTSTCHRLGVEPWAYLQDVLARLPNTPPERLAELLPDRWQAARQQQAGAAPAASAADTDPHPGP